MPKHRAIASVLSRLTFWPQVVGCAPLQLMPTHSLAEHLFVTKAVNPRTRTRWEPPIHPWPCCAEIDHERTLRDEKCLPSPRVNTSPTFRGEIRPKQCAIGANHPPAPTRTNFASLPALSKASWGGCQHCSLPTERRMCRRIAAH